MLPLQKPQLGGRSPPRRFHEGIQVLGLFVPHPSPAPPDGQGQKGALGFGDGPIHPS